MIPTNTNADGARASAKTIEHNGHAWEIARLGEGRYSVICLNPAIDDEGIDQTTWPSDAQVSTWIGHTVRFSDGGDSPRGVESIYDDARFHLQVRDEMGQWVTIPNGECDSEAEADAAGDALRDDVEYQCDMRVVDPDGDVVTEWEMTLEYAREHGESAWVADDGNAEIEFADALSAREAAEAYVEDGDWGERSSTAWISVYAWERCRFNGRTLDGDRARYKIAIEPKEPKCSHTDGHDWQSPHEIVGGVKENPGVWGHAGGVVIKEICVRCGCGRTTDTWAQDPADGEQGLTSISYQPHAHDVSGSQLVNALSSIRVESSCDAGCDWTEHEQSDFCAAVVASLSEIYPGVDVECEIAEGSDTRVFVYGRQRSGLVTFPEHEHDLIHTIKGLVQDVWNAGDFWGPAERDEA